MNKYRVIIVVVVLLAVVGGGIWFFKDEINLSGTNFGKNEVSQNTIEGNKLNENSSVNDEGVALAEGTFNVVISADGIKPEIFRVKKLQQLTVSIKNEVADAPSPFKFEKLPFDALVAAGGETSFTLVAPAEAGEYVFFSGDKKGVLIVEE